MPHQIPGATPPINPNAGHPGMLDPSVGAGGMGGMDMAQIQGILAGMTPEEQEKFLQQIMGDYSSQQQGIDEQLSQADALRGRAAPEGRQAGGMFIASNPLEHLAHGMGQVKSSRDTRSAQDQLREMGEQRTQGRMAVGRYLGG